MAATVTESESERVFAFLMERFIRLGFTEHESECLAEVGADWHLAEKMISQGCYPSVAFEILT